MRRNNQKLSRNECEEILETGLRGCLAVLGDDEYPYTVYQNYIYTDNKIYFHGAKEGHKTDAVNKHEKVSFCVLTEGVKKESKWWYTFKSVIVFGKIRFITDTNKIANILTKFGDKYFPSNDITKAETEKYLKVTQIMELNIEHISGKIVNEK